MVITLEEKAIVFTLQNNSINLKPLLHFIDSSFQNVKHFSNATVIFNENSEEIKKKYLLRWAYKIHQKNLPHTKNIFFQRLMKSFELPLHVVTSNNKYITQVVIITIDQIGSFEVSVSLSQYQEKIVQYFKLIFKDAITRSIDKATFRITIRTKSNLSLLKNILSKKEILSIPVTFITHGLSFKRLYPDEAHSAEHIYGEKLKKSYKILSISDESSSMEVKKNYRNMLKKYHPDIVYNQSDTLVQLYTKRFQVIQSAYEFVKEHHRIA